MAAQSNIVGRVVSWGAASSPEAQLVSVGGVPRATFAFNMSGPSIEYLPHTSTGVRSAISGLTSWTVTLNNLLRIPQIGNRGDITFANGHVVNADEFTLDIVADALDSTAFGTFGATPSPTFRTFIPGAFSWRGTWGGHLDGTTAIQDVGAAGNSGTATFEYGVNAAGSAVNLSGSIIPDAGGFALADGQPNRYTYSFTGNGTLKHAGQTSGIIISATSAVVPTVTSMVLSAGSGTRLSGALAMWTNISLRKSVGDMVEVTVQAQGSGDPNIS